ncbi:MAG: hypothetical protein P4L49_19015 [Desulfosporosinus sp.]|nr:hypothetical protein [Desulfosporosinus sp.]
MINLVCLKKNLFPLYDTTNSGQTFFALSPNIDAFNNLVLSLSKYALNEKIHIIHDEQKQFSKSLNNWVANINLLTSLKVYIEFIESKQNKLIQVIDYLTGHINDFFRQKSYCDKTYKSKEIKELISTKTNITSIYEEQKAVLDKLFPINDEVLYNNIKEEFINYNSK